MGLKVNSFTIQYTQKSVTFDRVSISYRTAGKGQPVCLIPSVARGCDDLTELSNALVNKGYKVILPEPRGINGSEGPLSDLNVVDAAIDVIKAIENELTPDFSTAVIAGHAYGSMVARACAEAFPDKVSGVVLIAAGGRNFSAHLSQAIDQLVLSDTSLEERKALLRMAFFANRSTLKESWFTGWSAALLASQRHIRANSNKDAWWCAGDAPILDLIGDEDPFRQSEQHESLASEFGKRVIVEVIPNASHALPDEQPEAVASLMHEFIQNNLHVIESAYSHEK